MGWPLPSIEIVDGVATMRFDDSDLFETKDRFEKLCASHADPAALVIRLWADAGGDPVNRAAFERDRNDARGHAGQHVTRVDDFAVPDCDAHVARADLG